jgi:hypothetical protein
MARMTPWETPQQYIDLDKSLTYVAIAVVLFLLLYSAQKNIGNASSTQSFSIIYLAIMLAVGYSAMRDQKGYGGFGTKENIIKGIGLGAVAAAFMLFATSVKLSSPLHRRFRTARYSRISTWRSWYRSWRRSSSPRPCPSYSTGR